MIDRVVIARVGGHLLSLPFAFIDEILGTDRIVSLEELPDDAVSEGVGDSHWVYSRGEWLPLELFLPDSMVTDLSQIIIVRSDETGRAFIVDEVLGIESPGPIVPFPKAAVPFTDIPFSGVRLWKNGPVLELDLSRLISLDLGGR
jgi:hypothetical protein